MILGRKHYAPLCCGLFVAATTLLDWLLNDTARQLPLSPKEDWHLELFGVQPRRVLPAPDLPGDRWLVLVCGMAMMLYGYMLAKFSREVYTAWRQGINGAYLKIVASAALLMGVCSGFLFFYGAWVAPTVWRFYLAVGTATLAAAGTFLVLRTPCDLYHAWHGVSKGTSVPETGSGKSHDHIQNTTIISVSSISLLISGFIKVAIVASVSLLLLVNESSGKQATKHDVAASIPNYISSENAEMLKGWLRRNPQYRIAEDQDYPYQDDLKFIPQYSDSPHPFYATDDFNGDGHPDFAVILIDQTKHPETAVKKVRDHADGSADYVFDMSQGFNTAIVVFNGPLHHDATPAFFDVGVGAISGSVIFCRKSVLIVGKFDACGGRMLVPEDGGYTWKSTEE